MPPPLSPGNRLRTHRMRPTYRDRTSCAANWTSPSPPCASSAPAPAIHSKSHQANQYLCGIYYATGRPEVARRHAAELADLPAFPPMAARFAGAASWARRLGDTATLAAARHATAAIAARWPNARTQAVDAHAAALERWSAGDTVAAEGLLLHSRGSAFGIWTLFDLAELYTRTGKWDLAEAYWKEFEDHRGTVIVKVWCPVMLVLGWLYRATAAQARGDRATAYRYSGKVLDHWGKNNPDLRVVRDAGGIHAITNPI